MVDSGTPPLGSVTFGALLESIAAKTPTPGGGAVGSAVGALAAALAGMVVSYSVGKKTLAAHESVLQSAMKELSRARAIMLTLADEDAAAYGLLNELQRLPEGDPRRTAELAAAQRGSVAAPMATLALCLDLLRLFETLAGTTNRHLRSDLAIAAVLAEGAARSSAWNVRVNAGGLPTTEEGEAALAEVERGVSDARARAARVEAACL